MDSQSIARILASYEQLAPRIDAMIAHFYDGLFAACPETRPMFQIDMTVQREHLASMLALLVRNLAFQDVIEQPLMDLGAQHLMIGVRPEQYPVVRDLLLKSIGESLGAAWTSDLRRDWAAVLDFVVASMLRGATRYALQNVRRTPQP